MNVKIIGNLCTVTKESGDPRFSGIVNAAGESRLLYHIKQILNAQGYDLIKKKMWKDSHLMDDMQQYLRARKPSDDPTKNICIYNGMWSIMGAEGYLNRDGFVNLSVVYNIFDK